MEIFKTIFIFLFLILSITNNNNNYFFVKSDDGLSNGPIGNVTGIAQTIINGIIQSDYNCVNSLVTKIGLLNYFSAGLMCNDNIVCDGTTECGLNIICDPNTQTVTSLKLQSKASGIISASDLNCFYQLNNITLINFNFDSNFLNQLNNTKKVYLKGSGASLNATVNQNIELLDLNITQVTVPSIISQVKLSNLIYLKNFKLLSNSSGVYQTLYEMKILNDLDYNGNGIEMDSLEIIIGNELPLFYMMNVTNFVIWLSPTCLFNSTSFNTMTKVTNLSIKQLGGPISPTVIRQFPIGLTQTLVRNTKLKTFYSEIPYQGVSGLIDLSNLPGLVNLTMINVGNVFSFNNAGIFPFSKLPKPLLGYFKFTNGNITNIDGFDFTIFNNITTVILSLNSIQSNLPLYNGNNISSIDLSYNSIKGSIDKSWCTTLLNISSNQISSTSIPTCFSSYFCFNNVYYNFLNNIFTISKQCGASQIPTVMKIIGKDTIMNGTDIGFIGGSSFTTDPPGAWKPLIQSQSFILENYNQPTVFNVSFNSSAGNFRVFKLSTMDQLLVSGISFSNPGDTSSTITIVGSNFGSDPNTATLNFNNGSVNSDGTIKQTQCPITSLSYSTITCQIKQGGYTKDFMNSLQYAVLKVNDLSVQFQVNTTISTFNGNIKLCPNNCNYQTLNGNCQMDGTCKCDIKFKGQSCEQPNIRIDSYKASNENGGAVQVFGYFTNEHQSLNVTLDGIACTLLLVSLDIISFIAPPGEGFRTLTINQNLNQTVSITYQYNHTCPNDCSGPNNGRCADTINGKCTCYAMWQSVDCSIPFIQCPMNQLDQICSGYGTCNNQTGVCACDSLHQGALCDIPFTQCPMNNIGQLCSGFGTCNNQTGVCSCDSIHQSKDCSLPYKQCPMSPSNQICSNNGQCNNQTGSCLCDSKYTGSICDKINLYCSSITSASMDGNVTITLYGWFGSVHDQLKVLIGGNDCPIINVDSSTINCTVPPSSQSGITWVNVTQNGLSYYNKNGFQYTQSLIQPVKEKQCPNNCNGNNGQCQKLSGICICNQDYTGYDCSAYSPSYDNEGSSDDTSTSSTDTNSTTTPKPTAQPTNQLPKSVSTIDNSTSIISINNEQTNYNLLILKLLEVDISGNTIESYQLEGNWIYDSINSNKSVYVFNQKLNNTMNQNDNTWIESTIEEVEKTRIQEFADTQFQLKRGQIKVSIKLNNYTFANNLNSLQLQIESSVDILKETNNQKINNCNDVNTNVQETNIEDSNLNYLKITKNGKVLYGRFINTVVSDGHNTFITSGIISNNNNSNGDTSKVIIGLNLPHCSQECLIDPDFSVLVDSNYKSTCDGSSSKKPWLLPVVVVVPIVTVTALSITFFFVIKKYRTSLLIAKTKYKFSLKSLSKKHKDDLYMPNN